MYPILIGSNKMKKYLFLALALFAGLSLFTACNEKNNPENPTETTPTGDDPSTGGDPTSYEEAYKNAAPGIYMRGNYLLAKGTDGSVFTIDDVTVFPTMEAVTNDKFLPADFKAWDGKLSTYIFGIELYNDNDGNWQTYTYEDTVSITVQTKYTEELVKVYSEPLKTQFLSIKEFQKVADGADFENLYVAIAKRVQQNGPIVKPSQMVLQYEEFYPKAWLSEYYPQEMETTGYACKYTGSGTITTMRVDKIFEWGVSVNDPKILWLPKCNVNDVANIKVTIENVSETDARAYIAKVKESGKYEHVTENEAEGVIAFGGDNEPENLDDKYSGAVYPMCTIMFIEGILRIEFNVAKLGLV